MKQAFLSDLEQVDIAAKLAAAGTPANAIPDIIQTVQAVLISRGNGLDRCARPLAFRKEADMDHPCFARGYIEKMVEYTQETSKRSKSSKDLRAQVAKYGAQLIAEIDRFFKSPK